MRAARWSAAAVALLGLLLSAFGADLPPRARSEAAGFTVLAGDFHVHSFPDGIPAWEAAREARRRRIDVIALTSHNSRFGWWMWTHRPAWIKRDDVIVLPGEELTGVGYHMALVGVTRAVGWRQSLTDAAAAAHEQGAAAILAHPAGWALARVLTDAGLRAVDGIEVAHPGMDEGEEIRRDFLKNYARAAELDSTTAAIGSSDFHYFESIGACRTYLFVREATADGVLEALKSGRTVACDAHGRTYGPAAWRPLVADRCREEASSPPDGDSAVARLATALVWAGLAGLVLAGAGT